MLTYLSFPEPKIVLIEFFSVLNLSAGSNSRIF